MAAFIKTIDTFTFKNAPQVNFGANSHFDIDFTPCRQFDQLILDGDTAVSIDPTTLFHLNTLGEFFSDGVYDLITGANSITFGDLSTIDSDEGFSIIDASVIFSGGILLGD